MEGNESCEIQTLEIVIKCSLDTRGKNVRGSKWGRVQSYPMANFPFITNEWFNVIKKIYSAEKMGGCLGGGAVH